MDSYQTLCGLLEKKEYRCIGWEEFKFLLASNLSDGAKLCWIYLRFNGLYTGGQITVSNKSISSFLNKAPSTVSRYLLELEKKGYISCVRTKKNKSWCVHTIHISFPEVGIQAIQETPDRAISVRKKEAIKQCGTVVDKSAGGIAKVDKGYSKFAKHTNNITMFKTNNNVVPSSKLSENNPQEQSETTASEKTIRILKEKLIILNEQFSRVDNNQKYEVSRKAAEIEGRLMIEQNKVEKERKALALQERSSKLDKELSNNIAYMNELPGKRRLEASQLARLQKLVLRAMPGKEATAYVNKLVYDIRFGSLSNKSYKTGKEMGVDLAINIAAKLAREGRYIHRETEHYQKLCQQNFGNCNTLNSFQKEKSCIIQEVHRNA